MLVALIDLIGLQLWPPTDRLIAATVPLPAVFVGSVAPILDMLLVLYAASLLMECQRRRALGAVLVALLFGAFVAASWIKFDWLGDGLQYMDILLVGDLMRALPTYQVAVAVPPLVGVAAMLAWNARLPQRASWPLFAPAAAAIVAIQTAGVSTPMVSTFANIGVQQTGHVAAFILRGVQEGAVAALLDGADEADAPPSFLGKDLPKVGRRSIHILVLESFIDPHSLTAYRYSDEPLAPAFRASTSRAYAPVFANKSSNAEFEILCGVPAVGRPGQVLFRDLVRDLDCLPRKLVAQGWSAASFVANSPTFFRAAEAYRHVGFTESYWQDDFDMSDRDGVWLSAQSQLAQVFARVAPRLERKEPLLVYSFLTSSHTPFSLDEAKRPKTIAVSPANDALRGFVNHLHYTSAAVEDYVARIRLLDPTALFVIVGDHAPQFGGDLGVYRESGIVPAGGGLRSSLRLFETMLVVIDGSELGNGLRLPQFLLPELIADRITDGTFCRSQSCSINGNRLHRPLPDMTFTSLGTGCDLHRPSAACTTETSETIAYMKMVRRLLSRE